MHISRIELENIKSHVRSTYEFNRGTTAITGENGAGKTSIIEAIAWALFDLLDYKKEDFVRRGAKKGIVRVTLESSLDEREYVVYRDSGTGYNVTDPRLDKRIADKKEEVFRFLWQHLGLEPGTDLRTLFRQAIGVPQGTFTAIFLEGATERKTAFDRLLKVEEYRQAAEKLRETSRFIDAALATVRETTARTEGELTRSQSVEDESSKITRQIKAIAAELETIGADVTEREARVKKFDDQERRLSEMRLAVERRQAEYEKTQLMHTQAIQALERSADAQSKLEAVRSQHKNHLDIVERLKNLENKRTVRDEVRSELAKIETAVVNVNAGKKGFDHELQKLTSAKQKIHSLKQKASEQIAVEKEIDQLKTEIAAARSSEERINSIERELGRLREKYQTNRAKLADAEGRSPQKQISELEQLHAELVKSYSDRKTEIEDEGAELTDKRRFLEGRKLRLVSLEKQLSDALRRLKKLADPAAEIRLLEKELLREPEIRSLIGEAESNLERLEAERRQVVERLTEFATLDAELLQLSAGRDESAGAHHTFLKHENEAAAYEQRRAELADAAREVSEKAEKLETARRDLENAGIDYDPDRHAEERAELRKAERRAAERRATYDAAIRREEQLTAELAKFAELRDSLRDALREKTRLEDIGETCGFIRDTLKEAAPRVARNYVHHVSIEANQLFREITGGAEHTLKWGEDYAISLEEEGFERPFQSLSGGEQMAAALAVRLALLKQLSDIRIAFFDEPTMSMDAERRENFAVEISRIKNFDQLFVISHDETFDNYVDNVVHVERSTAPLSAGAV